MLKNEADLLDEACRIIVQDCGFAMVWIGYAENDKRKSVRPVASAGFEQGYLENLNITWADTPAWPWSHRDCHPHEKAQPLQQHAHRSSVRPLA